MDENQTMDTVTQKEGKPVSGFSGLLNRYFHHVDKGSTTGREISVGILMGILSVCGIFMTMQLLETSFATGTIAEKGEMVASYYFIAMLISFVGSLLIGAIAKLPLVQSQSLGLATVLISLVGTRTTDAGTPALSYYNLIAVSFISAIVLAIVLNVPFIKEWLKNGVTDNIKKGLRVALGLIIALAALQLSGVVVFSGSSLPIFGFGQTGSFASSSVITSSFVSFPLFNYSNDPRHPLLLIAGIVAVLALVVLFVFKLLKVRHAYGYVLILATVFFFLFYFLLVCVNWEMNNISTDSLWGRLWMAGSEDAQMTHMSFIFSDSGMGIGKVFTEGFDFSAYTAAGGNVFFLFVVGILSVLFNTLAFNTTVKETVVDKIDEKDEKKANIITSAVNVASPIFSMSPSSYSMESLVAKEEGAVSGIAAISGSLVFFISMFIWFVPFLLATATSSNIQMNQYGHYGEVLYYLTECSFTYADIIMAVLGFVLVFKNLDIDYKNYKEVVPFAITIVLSLLTTNIAIGAGLGILSQVLISAVAKPEDGEKRLQGIEIPQYVLGGLGLITFILSLTL